MKYLILNQIEVLDFNISSGELNYVNVNKDLIFRDKIMSKETTVAGYFFNNNFFFFWDNLDTLILDINAKKIFNIGLVAPHYETFSNSRLICNEYKDSISFEKKLIELNLQDFSKKNILDSFEYGLKLRIGNDIICTGSHTTLKSINLETGTYNWEVDLGIYISSVLGVFANKLWIYTGTNELISLALDTGQILQRIRSHDFHPNVSDSGFVAYAVHFEEQHGRITFLEHRTYVEFDLVTCQVIRQKSFDTSNPQADWAFSVNSLDDNYCYFVGNQGRDAGFAQWVGVLNRATLEVEWSEHLGKLNPKNYWALNKAPLSDGNKLYVHDSEGTLHIFEKTEDN